MGVLKDMKFILNRLRPCSPFIFIHLCIYAFSAVPLAGYLGNGNEVCMKNALLHQIDGTAVESSCSSFFVFSVESYIFFNFKNQVQAK